MSRHDPNPSRGIIVKKFLTQLANLIQTQYKISGFKVDRLTRLIK
jgi:hypothetical protein